MSPEERAALTEACRAAVERRQREPGDDDDIDDSEWIPLGRVLAALRFGLIHVPPPEPPPPPKWLTDAAAFVVELRRKASARRAAAPEFVTRNDVEWERLLRQHADDIDAMLGEYTRRTR